MDELERTKLAAQGDQVAIQILLLEHYDHLKAYIAPRVPGSLRRLYSPDDIVQEAAFCVHRDITTHF